MKYEITNEYHYSGTPEMNIIEISDGDIYGYYTDLCGCLEFVFGQRKQFGKEHIFRLCEVGYFSLGYEEDDFIAHDAANSWCGEGWYYIGFSDGGMDYTNDGAVWLESQDSLCDMLRGAWEQATDTHLPWTEYQGCEDDPVVEGRRVSSIPRY